MTNNCPSGSYSSFVLLNGSILVFVFKITFLDRQRSQAETCFLWTYGIFVLKHLKPLGWKLLLLSSLKGCTETPAPPFSMQNLTMCALSQAISNGKYKPRLICFTSRCTRLLSVTTSQLGFSGFHPHRSEVFPNSARCSAWSWLPVHHLRRRRGESVCARPGGIIFEKWDRTLFLAPLLNLQQKYQRG